jgi:hypothetical protein
MSTLSFPDIGLRPRDARAAARRARQEGKTPSEYLRTLVERDPLAGGSFDEVVRPPAPRSPGAERVRQSWTRW